MRPCNQCGAPVENDLANCDSCSSLASKNVLYMNGTATPVSSHANDKSVDADDNRFFRGCYVATLVTSILICCQVFAYLQWPWPFGIFAGAVIGFMLLGFATQGMI